MALALALALALAMAMALALALAMAMASMPLFRCQNKECGVIENTALTGCSWGSDEKLCSACCPKNFFSAPNTWHGKFDRSTEVPEGEKLMWE